MATASGPSTTSRVLRRPEGISTVSMRTVMARPWKTRRVERAFSSGILQGRGRFFLEPAHGLQGQDEGRLIAVGELGAALALPPDLPGQAHHIYLLEAQLLKEAGLVGQGEDGGDAQAPALLYAGLHQAAAQALLLAFLLDGQGLYLRQVRPADMEGDAGHHLAAVPRG